MSKKPTFLFYNMGGDFLGIQMRIQAEGFRTVSYYEKDTHKGKGKAGKGLVECVEDPFDIITQFIDHPDDLIILIDDNSRGSMCDALRSFGYRVVGSSEFSDQAEHDRAHGNSLAEKIGLDIPPSHSFKDFEQASSFVEKNPEKKFYFKPDGVDLAGSSKTYGAKNQADLLRYLAWVQGEIESKGHTVEKIELQERVDGIEVDMASWFNGVSFAPVQTVCFEQKKLQGLGAAQGCYGQVTTNIPLSDPYQRYLKRLEPLLNGTGPNEWAINSIVSAMTHEPNFLEWTPRFGWDSTFGELALLTDAGISLAQFFIRLAYGISFPSNYLPVGRYSASVRLFSESPGTPGTEVNGKPLWIDPAIEPNIWFYSVKKAEDQHCYTITDTCFAVATACGDTVEEAVAAVYSLLDPKKDLITTPDLFYSKHIGEGVNEAMLRLKEWGIVDEY